MLKSMSGIDAAARTLAQSAWDQSSAISGAMGSGPTTPDYTAWITGQFTAAFTTHKFDFGPGVPRTLALNTAYQATDPTKAANVKVILSTPTSVGIGSPQDNTFGLYFGSTNAVAGGTGTLGDSGGLALNVTLISLGLTQTQSATICLPIGYYFAVRRLTGTQTVISQAYDQTAGLT